MGKLIVTAIALATTTAISLASMGSNATASDVQADLSIRKAAVSLMQAKLGSLRGSVETDDFGVFLTQKIFDKTKQPEIKSGKISPEMPAIDALPTGAISTPKKPVPIVLNEYSDTGIDTMTTASIAPPIAENAEQHEIKTTTNKVLPMEIIFSEDRVDWPLPSLPTISFQPVISLPKTISKMWRGENEAAIIVPLNEEVIDYPTRG